MNPTEAERERREVGLTPDEVREINKPKSVQGDPLNNKGITRRDFLRRAGAAAIGAVAGALLPDSPSKARADGSVPDAPVTEVKYTHRVSLPRVLKDISGQKLDEAERPLWPERFGEFAPYNFEIVNKGNTAGVNIGKQELLDNLRRRLVEWGNAPEVPRRVVVYESINQLFAKSDILRRNPPSVHPGTNLLGPSEWRITKVPDGSLRLDISLPGIKDWSQLEQAQINASGGLTLRIIDFLFTDKDGNYQDWDRFGTSYTRSRPLPIYEKDENNALIGTPFSVKYISP